MTASVLEQWFIAYKQYIYTFLLHYVGPDNADDLLQETFIRAMRGLKNFRGDADPKTWLCKIARNAALDFLKKNKRQHTVDEFDEVQFAVASTDLTPEELAEQQELKAHMAQLIASLKDNYRDVVLLHGIMELSIQETAEVLGWGESKVRVTYHRALKALHRIYTSEQSGGEGTWTK